MVLYSFVVNQSRCINCGACMDVCPTTCIDMTRPKAIGPEGKIFSLAGDPFIGEHDETKPKEWMMEKPHVPIQEGCIGCQVCVRECPTEAIIVAPDQTKLTLNPKFTLIKRERVPDDGYWHPLSAYTTDFLKRPVKSPWSDETDWKMMAALRGMHQTWRTMEKQ